jgi:hypothetical protein
MRPSRRWAPGTGQRLRRRLVSASRRLPRAPVDGASHTVGQLAGFQCNQPWITPGDRPLANCPRDRSGVALAHCCSLQCDVDPVLRLHPACSTHGVPRSTTSAQPVGQLDGETAADQVSHCCTDVACGASVAAACCQRDDGAPTAGAAHISNRETHGLMTSNKPSPGAHGTLIGCTTVHTHAQTHMFCHAVVHIAPAADGAAQMLAGGSPTTKGSRHVQHRSVPFVTCGLLPCVWTAWLGW